MADAESIKKEIDTINTNDQIEVQEMEEFLKSENNIKKLGEAMNSEASSELLQEMESVLKDLCEKLLLQEERSENQQNIIDYFINTFGDKYPEIKEKAQPTEAQEESTSPTESSEELLDENTNLELLDQIIAAWLSNPLTNLTSLGIDVKKAVFNWENLRKDIKTIEDVEKINGTNIANYVRISPDVPQENYEYIANNIKEIITKHLNLNPNYKTILGGSAAGMTIEGTINNNEYIINLYQNVQKEISKQEDVQINTIVSKINNGSRENLQFVQLRCDEYLGDKTQDKQNEIASKIFKNFSSTNPDNFLNACNINRYLKDKLENSYILYCLEKEKVLFGIKDEKGNDKLLLDFSKKNKFAKFLNKGGQLTENINFDEAYKYSEDFYKGLEGLTIDETIPLNDILNFFSFREKKGKENDQLTANAQKYGNARMSASANAFVPINAQAKQVRDTISPYDKQIRNNCINIEEEYVALLLKSKNRPTGKISAISGSNLTLDFSKGNKPEDIVRDKFGEKLTDSRNDFVYNIDYDRKAAAGSFAGMLAGIAASGASCVSGNIWLAAGAFTVTSRAVNGLTQETLNAAQYAVESISGQRATGGNQVNDFGDSFMKGVGAYEPVIDRDTGQPILDENGKIQYQFIGWEKFGSNLVFDYLGGVAMFGAFKALGPSFEAIKSIKIAGKPLEFVSKWLFVQNFGIDMPMNALHQGYNTFRGLGDTTIHGNAANIFDIQGNKTNYESGNIRDALMSMYQNIDEHLSFENQAQVFLNTFLYCGMLEAGQGLVSKIKSYTPAARIEKYESSNRKFQEAQRDFMSEISKRGLELNKDFKLIDAKTKKPITIGDARFLEFTPSLIKLKGTLAEHTKATQELVESERALSNDGSKTYGLLKRMKLISDKQPPLNILKQRIVEAKEQYKKAIESDNLEEAHKLKDAILDHQSAQITLISEFHPDAIDNIKLSNEERIQKSKELLQSELTTEQEQAILDAHNAPGDAYSLSIPELMAKSRILFKAGFTEAQVRTLIESCICGKKAGIGERTSEKISKKSSEETSEKPGEKTGERTSEKPGEKTGERTSEKISKKSSEETSKKSSEETSKKSSETSLIETTKVKGGKENALEDIKTIKENLEKQLDNLEESKCPQKLKQIIKEKMKTLENEIKDGKLEEIDLDPENGTFRSFGGFEKFIENLINRGPSEINQNFLNNIKLTIDYMTKRIINVGEAEPITLKEWESRMDIGEDFMKAMEKHMINQWLDNPQYFNSHGFDHTILVHSLIVKVREGLKLSTDTIAKKYGLSQEKSNKLYNSLIELSAALHDLGYPIQSKNGWEKTTHATSGAELFYKELKPKFEEFITKEIGLDADVAGDLACDMYNAVCFHGADKVESHYVSRIEGMDSKGRLYGGTLVSRSGAITGEKVRENLDFQDFRISYKSEGFREGAQGRYTGVYDGKLVEFQSANGKDRQIVKREGDKGKLKSLKEEKYENVSVDDVRSSVQERQNLSRTTAFSQALELSKNWGSDIKIYTKEGGEPVEFKRVIDGKEIRFERKTGESKTESVEDFIKENDILRIEGEGKKGENHKIELNVENLGKINEQAINQALGWLCDLEIKTDKGDVTYEKETGKYKSNGKEITKEELLNEYKINEIKSKVKGESGEEKTGRTITVNDNAYEGRFLNNDGTGLEYRSRDLMDDPLMSMIRIADNLDMAFNRLIPSQRNSIFLTALYNLENGGEIATLFQKMEDFNKRKKGKLEEKKPPTEQEIREGFAKELNIDIYKIFEEKGHETNEGRDQDGKKQITRKFDFTKYYKDGKFDLGTFKQDLFNTIRDSKAIETGYGDETLDMSHDLMNEGMIGSYSVRHMVGLRPIENVNFNINGFVEIKIDMYTYFTSDISSKIVDENGKSIRLVEYHLWREGTALKAVPLNGKNIKSYIVDRNGKRIGEINGKGVVDYREMFENGDKLVPKDNGTIDYSGGIIKSEYERYKDSPIFKSRTGEGKEGLPQ